MKSLVNGRFVIAVLTIACLMIVLVAGIRSSFSGAGDYDPWLDINDDGKIDMKDIGGVARAFGTSGPNNSKASIEYDSGWIDITDKCGQYFNVTHNMNSTDVMVDIQGKTTLDGGTHQKYLGGTSSSPGWSKTYQELNFLNDFVQTDDGGYVLVGEKSVGGMGYGLEVIKVYFDGTVQWNKTYADFWQARSVVKTSEGGYAILGYSSAGALDAALIKIDSIGNMQWNRTYGGAETENVHDLIQTSDGGYAFVGGTLSYGTTWEWWLVKTDSNGNQLWSRTYGGGGMDVAHSILQISNGGYMMAGYGFANLIETDATGNLVWSRYYGMLYCMAMVKTRDQGYALAGEIYFTDADQDFYLVKTDSYGNLLWSKNYGGSARDIAYSIVETYDGGYALAGGIDFSITNEYSEDCWLVKTDSLGNMQWSRRYGGEEIDMAYSVLQKSSSEYVLACTYRWGSNGAGMLIKIDDELGLAWTDSTPNAITLYRGATDPYWNFVRVRLWKPR